MDLLGYVFVTSGSQPFSACSHGWTCSDIGTYLLRHFRFLGIQHLQARVDLLGYVFVTSGSQAFSTCRHSGLARIIFSLPVESIVRKKIYKKQARGPLNASLSLPFFRCTVFHMLVRVVRHTYERIYVKFYIREFRKNFEFRTVCASVLKCCWSRAQLLLWRTLSTQVCLSHRFEVKQ